MTTITNLVLNPSGEVDTSGISGTVGSVPARVAMPGVHGAYAVEFTGDGSEAFQGGFYSTVSDAGGVVAPGTSVVGVIDRLSGSGTVSIWIRATHSDATVQYFAAQSVTLSSTPVRAVLPFGTTSIGKITTGFRVYINTITATPVSVRTDGVMVHEGTVPVDYFDGDSPNAEWTATPHASTSVLTLPDRRIFPVLKIGSQQRIGPLRAGKA